MKELNLMANGREQERILTYLKANVSNILADKISNGVLIDKNGKKLLNKKSLDGFMKYACEEARKQCDKNARGACIDDDVVFGWAIHYFEEDSIEGTLYNEDGTEYKPAVSCKPNSQTNNPTKPAKPQSTQTSLFDFMEEKPSTNEQDKPQNQINEIAEEDDDYPQPTPEEIREILEEMYEEDKPVRENIHEWYTAYTNIQNKYPTDIIAYKLGGFYEVFGDKAIAIADELSLTLTSRDCGLENRVPMIGFPYHIADKYFNKICKNHALVIVENKDKIRRLPKQLLDIETGEIIDDIPKQNPNIDERLLAKLSEILGDVFIVRGIYENREN